ncbi:MAG: MFS transporter [Proteobacteria bacterium]|nr:MFS transporter [Pseudomonadota bacterium]MBU1685923.1 MFS transporter [Pseudomonadota bacterium]
MTPSHNPPHKWKIFLLVAVGVFMSTLDSSMVNIALPTILKDFHSTLPATEWIVLIYLLTITATMLFWGHLGDRNGRNRVYGAGMLVFGLGSLSCTIAPSLPFLVTSRCGQALGAAMLMATGPAIIRDTFPREQLGRTLGLIGVAVSLGLMSGPPIGGFLVQYASWRTLFFITVPIGLAAAVVSLKILPGSSKDTQNGTTDWPGALLWALGLSLGSIVMTHGGTPTARPLLSFGMMTIAIICLILFFRREKVASHPILPPDLLRDRFFSMGILSAVLSFATLFAAIMLTPFFLDRVLGLPASRMGLIMTALPAAIMLTAPVSGYLSDRIERRIIATLGIFIATAAMFSLTSLEPTSGQIGISIRLAILGCGQAMFLSPNSAAVLSGTKPNRTGTAAALLATSRNLGMLLGIALAGLVFSLVFSRLTGGLDMRDFQSQYTNEFMIALKSAFLAAALVGSMGTLTSWGRGMETIQDHESPL